MLFAALQLAQWLVLMGAVILGTWLLKKVKLSDTARKITNAVIVLLAILFFFIPFDEILTFRTSDTAFSATVLGEALAEDEGEMTHGVFFRDKRGTYSTVFFYQEDGRYHKCAAGNRETLLTKEQDGIYVDVYHIAETEDDYILVRGFTEALVVTDSAGTVFETGTLETSSGTLRFAMACIPYGEDYALLVNGEEFVLE